MIRVYIANRERGWIEKMKAEFPWDETGCELIGTAADGELALQGVERLQPDILITDVDMPTVSGATLLEEYRRISPDMAILIVTGSEDFEAARRAIDLEIDGYVMRPVNRPELRRAVEKICRRHYENSHRASIQEQRSRKIREAADFFLSKVVRALLAGGYSEEEMSLFSEHMRLFGVDLDAGAYVAIEIASRDLIDELYAADKLIRGLRAISADSVHLVKLNAGCVGGVILGDRNEDIVSQAYAFSERVEEKMRQMGYGNARIGIGDPTDTRMGIRTSAVTAEARLLMGKGKGNIIGPREEPECILQMQLATEAGLYELLRYAKPDALKDIYNEYVMRFRLMNLPESMITGYLRLDVLLTAVRIIRENDGDPEEILKLPDYRMTLPESEKLNNAVEESYTLLKEAVGFRARLDSRTGNAGVAKARYYLDSHFADPGLMLKDAAQEAGMSPSRFSTVFAQEMGCTFTEYVTGLRIEKAKELLAHTNMRIAQIAGAVGYNDPHYFSWIFRKTVGMTPSECRESARGSEEEKT